MTVGVFIDDGGLLLQTMCRPGECMYDIYFQTPYSSCGTGEMSLDGDLDAVESTLPEGEMWRSSRSHSSCCMEQKSVCTPYIFSLFRWSLIELQ